MEEMKTAIEKLALGTITRGLLWVFGALTVRYGMPVVGENDAVQIATRILGGIMIIIAYIWSKKKDKANKEAPSTVSHL